MITPIGLSRVEAAKYIGIGTTKFDELVAQGIMPMPRLIGRRKIWDRRELEISFGNLPSADDDNSNDWDEI